ncbi:MAG: T9SS C-terminal target domain-containing protein, partial [Calditrichaeota bacterium]
TNAKKIAINDGDQQTGYVGQFLQRDLRVLVLDQHGNPVSSQPIRFRIVPSPSKPVDALGSLGKGSAADTSINSDQLGIAAVKWRLGHYVGTYQVQAGSNGDGPLEGSPLVFNATALADLTSADSSKITVAPPELMVSNGEIRATVTVTLRDRYNNPVVNKAVSLDASGNGNLITQPTTTTDSNGKTTGFLASREAGIKYVTARDINSGVALLDTATVTFGSARAARIAKAAGDNGDTQKRNVGTVLEKPLKVLVTDQFGNPIANVAVTFTAKTGGGMMVEPQPVRTDNAGIASSTYRLGLQPGANLVEASSTGLDGSPVNFSSIAEQPAQMKELVVLSGNHLTGEPGQTLPEPLAVRLLDNLGWPVADRRVRFEVKANDAVITSENPIATNMYGIASAEMKFGTRLGLNVIQASLTDLAAVSVTFYDTTKVIHGSGATSIQMVNGNNQSGNVGQTLPIPLTVRITDAYNNPIPGITVTFKVIEDQTVQGVGRLEGGVKAMPRTSNELGIASVYYTLGEQAGLNKVRASSAGLQPEFIEFSIYGESGSAFSMRKWSGDEQTGEMDRVLIKPISVKVVDRYGNPARGGKVNFIVLQGGGSIVEPQPILSDAYGIAQVHWRLGPRPNAYTNVAQAIADGLPGGTFLETFTATGDPAHWPNLELPTDVNIWENDLLTFKVWAKDSDNPPVTCSSLSIPDSAKLVNNGDGTWTFLWRPDFNEVLAPLKTKSFYAVFSALDLRGGKDIDSVRINVTDLNRAPIITRFWPTNNVIKIEPGTLGKIEFGVETMDADGDLVTVTWYVDGNQVAYGQTYTMDLSLYPPWHYYSVLASANDHSATTTQWWGVKVKVELVNFSCMVTPYKGVTLEWETADQQIISGFNVLKSLREDGEYVQVNQELLPVSENGRYQFIDKEIAGGYRYYYQVEEVSVDGVKTKHGPVFAEAPIPKEFRLAQNYPNPFNPETTIRFDLPNAVNVTLEVYNILGQRVRMLLEQKMEPGYHAVMWDGADDYGVRVGSGVYYFRINAGSFSDVKKMALIK